MTDEQIKVLGELVAEMLDIVPNQKGRYETNWGDKTALGLGASVLRLVNEAREANHVAD